MDQRSKPETWNTDTSRKKSKQYPCCGLNKNDFFRPKGSDAIKRCGSVGVSVVLLD